MDCRSFITFDTFFPLLLYAAKDVALGHDDKAQIRILKSFPQCPFADHNLARKQFVRQISAVKCRNFIILKILTKTLCTRPRRGQHQHAVSVFPQPQDILGKQ